MSLAYVISSAAVNSALKFIPFDRGTPQNPVYYLVWDQSRQVKLADMHTVFAKTALSEKRLYKYCSMVDDLRKSRVKEILLSHRIRFSCPSELNDPIEGKPILQLGDWASPAYRQRFEEWVWTLQQRHIQIVPPKDAFISWVRRQTKAEIEKLVKQISEDNQAAIEEKWRVLSLSATPSDDLMWSHYAGGHKGVALIFDASVGEFGMAYKVNYIPERVPQDFMTDDLDQILDATILTKRSTWAYEKEYRCVLEEPDLDQQFLRFNPAHLLGVVFGFKTSLSDIESLVACAAGRSTPLQYWKASLTSAGSVQINPYCA